MIVDGNSANLAKTPDSDTPGHSPGEAQLEPASRMSWREQAKRLKREAWVSYFVFKHPRAPWYAKLVGVCSAGYMFSPIQLIPNYIPVIGVLDDLLVIFLGIRLLQRITPPDVLTESRALADAEVHRKAIRSRSAVVLSIAIGTAWLLAAIVTSALLAAYIYHR